MIRRDYTQEIGAEPPKKSVSWPVVIVVIAALAAVFWWRARTQNLATPSRGGNETSRAANSLPAPDSPCTLSSAVATTAGGESPETALSQAI